MLESIQGDERCTSASHALLKLDPAAWAALPYVGTMAEDRLELRDCPACRSTLAREIECPTCGGDRTVLVETCRNGDLHERSQPCPDCVEDDEREPSERYDEDAECRWEVGL